MRPLSLTVEGFTAFKDACTVRFDGLQLAVFLGPNGAGKSSLLEAILIALYGTAPRMRSRQIRDYISHGRDHFRIEFEFRLEQNFYRVQRQYSRKSVAKVRLEKKEGADWKPLTDKVEETNRAISSLLRMGYDTFTKAVLLPQNLFDQFLKGDKDKRREVLDELLNLNLFEKIGALAGEKRRQFQDLLSQDEHLLAELREQASSDRLAALEAADKNHKAALQSLNQEKQKGLDAIEKLEKRYSALLVYAEKKKRIHGLTEDKTGLEKNLKTNETEFHRLKDEAEKLEERFQSEIPSLEEEEKRLASFGKIASDRERLLAEEKSISAQISLREKMGVEAEKGLSLIRRKRNEIVEALTENKKIRAQLEKDEERFQLLLIEKENLSGFGKKFEELQTLKAQLKKIQTEKISPEQLEIIHQLRSGLSRGDYCPVCAQPILAVPADIQSVLSKHEKEVSAFEKQLRIRLDYPEGDLLICAREEFTQLKKKSEALKDRRKQEDDLNRKLSQFDAQLQKDEHEFHRMDKECEGMKALLEKLQKDKMLLPQIPETAEADLSGIRKKLTELRTCREKTLRRFHQSEERINQLSIQLKKVAELLINESIELSELEKKIEKAEDIKIIEKQLKDFKAGLAEIETKINFHSTESGKIKQQLADASSAQEKLKTISVRQEDYRKKEAVYGTIHQDLQKNRLPDFLYGNVLETLLEMGGERLLEFSQGRYRFSLQGTGDIQVLDGWNANEPRPAESLSGGETFAASLALALALSDYLQGKQQVECLFIDEGFGNLDLETRGKVAEVLALLRRENKLIGVVTHIEELADYFPHQILIEKLPEGSRIREQSNVEPASGRISEQVA